MSLKLKHYASALAAGLLVLTSAMASAQATVSAAPADSAGYTYADLVDLADSAPLVIHAKVAKMLRVEDARAPGLGPGMARYYVKASTVTLLAGQTVLGESLAYLVDLPLDARGKVANLKKRDVLLFARPVPGRPGELQLISPGAQMLWSEPLDARIRRILQALVSPDAPARVTGVRELLHVPGTLAGQGETQIFLTTQDGSAASLTVRHQPGAPAAWGASFSELVADVSRPPRPETLEWYRLACFLPNTPPPGANVSEGPAARQQAAADYRMVLGELGLCRRSRG